MDFLKEFISEYGIVIIGFVLTTIAGYLGVAIKNIYQKHINDKTKEDVVKTCVNAVEQIYKDLHGDEKLQKALEAASEILNEKDIYITSNELRMLIEAAVAEFNDAFNKTSEIESSAIEQLKYEDVNK